MRYLITKSFQDEWKARRNYIFDTLQLWTTVTELNSFICLNGFPIKCIDILFIIGHHDTIKKYLETNLHSIEERTIVAITCDSFNSLASINKGKKTMYIARQNEKGMAELLKGSEYGFSFDLTESEILFYRSKNQSNLELRLESAFTKIQ